MPLVAVVTTNFSDEFDKIFQQKIARLGIGAGLDRMVSDGDIKTYCVSLSDEFLETKGGLFIGDCFRFSLNVMKITFLQKRENLYEQ